MQNAISLDRKVEFLRQTSSYPTHTSSVETIETHMSWVFLTDRHAYKLKKPIRFGRVDFRAVASRLHFCQEEIRLNRRLADDVYLEVVPLAIGEDNKLSLGSTHEPAMDWLVKMRRLPACKMLDYVVGHGQSTYSDIERVAERLLRFYHGCPSVVMKSSVLLGEFRRAIGYNERVLCRPRYDFPQDRVRELCGMQRLLLRHCPDWIGERVAQGKVVEGHGDLRPEHICLEEQVSIIDCLEFSRELRLVDPADEIGYLALELERLGKAELAAGLTDIFCSKMPDWPNEELLHFYQAFRAGVRARIAILHLDKAGLQDPNSWYQRALAYLELAERHQYAIRIPSIR